MAESFYVGITDTRWFHFVREKHFSGELGEEINFWIPGGNDFKALSQGEMFLFKLHSRKDTDEKGEIVGGGYFVRFERMSVSEAWNKFEYGNGFSSFSDFVEAIIAYKSKFSLSNSLEIGCIVLKNPFFLKKENWIAPPIDWKNSIVSGKKYSTNGYVGNKLYHSITQIMSEESVSGRHSTDVNRNTDEKQSSKTKPLYNFVTPIMSKEEQQMILNGAEIKKKDEIRKPSTSTVEDLDLSKYEGRTAVTNNFQKKYSWYGIDFGTTNSAAFSFTGIDEDNIIPIHYGDDEGRPFPSVVAIDKETGEVISGREAKDQRNALNKTHVYFSSIKTIIDSNQTWTIAGKTWTPEDVASEILKALKERVERNNDSVMDEVVMAVPVGYSAEKKEHLRNAARKANIEIKMFISEPTAAFCSNYKELCACKNVAVFDWGGGTLDVVVLKIENGNISELAADGMMFAGNDIDLKIAGKMHSRFTRNKEPIPMEDLPDTVQDQLLSKCEKAKIDFEDEDVVAVSLNRYGDYGAVRDNMEYEYFSLLIEPDVDNAIKCLNNAIEKAGLNVGNIDRILCVGGSSKLRPLREKLESIFGEDMLLYPEKVMWDIAKGAAMISTRKGGYRLSKSIGLQLSDGSYFPLFKQGQPIPCSELNMNFSVVDQGEESINDARFIFTDSDNPEERELYEPFVLPLRGFADEYIRLSCYIDQNNVFKVKLGSNRVSDSRDVVWHYDGLKVGFHIEDK